MDLSGLVRPLTRLIRQVPYAVHTHDSMTSMFVGSVSQCRSFLNCARLKTPVRTCRKILSQMSPRSSINPTKIPRIRNFSSRIANLVTVR